MVADFLHVLPLYTAKQTVVTVRRVEGRESGGGFGPCRGGEGGESARLGEALQSLNLGSRRFGSGWGASQNGRHCGGADFLHVLPLYTAKQTVVTVRRVEGRGSGCGFFAV